MHTYKEAADYLGKKTDRPVGTGRATRVHRVDEHHIAICLHGTDVVTYCDDGTCVLYAGSWQTLTTKERINEYSPTTVHQEKGLWYIGCRWRGEAVSLFYDGMVIKGDGAPVKPKLPEATERYKVKLDKIIKRYVDGFVAHVQKEGAKEPQTGDCFGCYFTACAHAGVKTGTQTGKGKLEGGKIIVEDTTGKPEPMGIDHYFSHFQENYFVASLLYNAFWEQHYGGGPGIGYMLAKGNPREVRRVLGKFFRKLKPELLKEFIERKGKLPEAGQ